MGKLTTYFTIGSISLSLLNQCSSNYIKNTSSLESEVVQQQPKEDSRTPPLVEEPKQEMCPEGHIVQIKGKIVDVYKERISYEKNPIWGKSGTHLFNYEILFVDVGDDVKKVLLAKTSTYRKGDEFDTYCRCRKEISLKEVINATDGRFSDIYVPQNTVLNIDATRDLIKFCK